MSAESTPEKAGPRGAPLPSFVVEVKSFYSGKAGAPSPTKCGGKYTVLTLLFSRETQNICMSKFDALKAHSELHYLIPPRASAKACDHQEISCLPST